LLTEGQKILLNHSFSASFILFSKSKGVFINQVREISQIKMVSFGITLFSFEEIIETAKLKSIQGSSIFSHLEIFK
jgi:hypothetical protein